MSICLAGETDTAFFPVFFQVFLGEGDAQCSSSAMNRALLCKLHNVSKLFIELHYVSRASGFSFNPFSNSLR